MPANNSADLSPREARVWPMPVRVAFRFCFLYWLLYMLPSEGAVSIFDLLPFGGIGKRLSVWSRSSRMWSACVCFI